MPAGVGRLAAAAAGGFLIALCFLRFWLWPLAWLAFVPILAAIDRSPSRRATAGTGFVAGLATNVPAFYWLVHTIHVFGGFPIVVAVLFYAILSAYSAFQFVLLALALRRVGFGPLAVFPPLVWVALEFLYPKLFPWRMANSQLEATWLLQTGDLAGPFGLSFVMLWVSAALARALGSGFRAARGALVAAGLATALVTGYGALRTAAIDRAMAEADGVTVGIVQGNLSIEEKGSARYLESNLATYRRLTTELPDAVEVVIWPETVIHEPLPRTLEALPPLAVTTLGIRRPLLTGALMYEGRPQDPRYYNTVVLFGSDGTVLGASDKIILMPFGEYIPFGSIFPVLKELSPATGDFEAGEAVRVLEVPGAGRFGPLNCYEDLVASIPRRAVAEGGAEVLFTVANDAWFGPTAAPFQHEALALWRAVENRRFLVRVTNTGVTDVVDAAGRVVRRLPIFEPVSAVVEVKRMIGTTPYHRFGDAFAWLAAGLALAGVVLAGVRRRG